MSKPTLVRVEITFKTRDQDGKKYTWPLVTLILSDGSKQTRNGLLRKFTGLVRFVYRGEVYECTQAGRKLTKLEK